MFGTAGTFVARVILPLAAVYAAGRVASRAAKRHAILNDSVDALNAECNELTSERNELIDRINAIKDQNLELRRELAEARQKPARYGGAAQQAS